MFFGSDCFHCPPLRTPYLIGTRPRTDGRFEFEMAFESMRVDLQLCCENAFRPRYVNGRSSRRALKSALNFGLLLSSIEALVLISGHALIVQLAEIRSRYRMAAAPAAPAAGKKGRK